MFGPQIGVLHYKAIKNVSQKGFRLDNKIYPYYRGTSTLAYLTERTVELPVAKRLVDNCRGNVLEVGNVLSQHYPVNHTVVDKYEQAPNVLNVDVCDYKPETKYDLIVSISTLEHVGYDDGEPDKTKIRKAFDNLLSLLTPNGLLFFTAPTGYNNDFDKFVIQNSYGFKLSAMLRDNVLNEWHQTMPRFPLALYDKPYRYGNMVLFGYYSKTF
jgi:SAM-dependent methyltransferase